MGFDVWPNLIDWQLPQVG